MGNLNTNFTPITKGKAGVHWMMRKVPFKESVAMESGSAVYWIGDGTDGQVTKCTTTSGNFAGILMEPIAATDSDYATEGKLKLIAIPLTRAAWAEFTVGSGTFTAADVGKNADFADEKSVAVDTSTHDHVRIEKYLSATRGLCSFWENVE